MPELKVTVRPIGSFKEIVGARTQGFAQAVTDAVDVTTEQVKQNWRGQIIGAGLSRKIANAVRTKRYPKTGVSIGAAGEITIAKGTPTKLICELQNSATITAAGRQYLAVPTENVQEAQRGQKVPPHALEILRGFKLRFAQNRRGTKMLVADTVASKAKSGGVRPATRGRTRQGRKVVTTVFYILVPQVHMKKKLRLIEEGERIAAQLPQRIAERFK